MPTSRYVVSEGQVHKGPEARERIRISNSVLNAFVEIRPPEKVVEGPLTGLAVGVKDCFYDSGRTPTMGSRVHPEPSPVTATVLERIRRTGGDVVGYTNLHEWAIGGTSAVTATGPVRNPWDLTRVPGGSSGGSGAALAAGLVDVAVGTDTGGSIRIPAGCCGVVGLKPTQDRVPTHGYVGEGGPTDQVGPMARTVALTRTLFECMIDESLADVDPTGLRVGIARGEAFENLQPAVARVYDEATGLFGTAIDVDIPGWDRQWWANAALFIGFTGRYVADALRDRPEDFHPDALKVLRWGNSLPDELIAEQHRVKDAAKRQWVEMFEDIDVLVTPTLPGLPPAIDDLKVRLPADVSEADVAFGRFCGPMNLVGVPCLSVPCGRAGDLPVNLSLTAAPGRDDVVLAMGERVEELTDRAFSDRTAAIPGAGSSA
jgi:aspartyl-tRNA(Asn)/glutamyl-tRNA(Gln) amidotransferase subunit A